VVDVIRHGGLFAYPAETMYGLGGDALRADVAARLAEAKESPPGRPFLVLLDREARWPDVASAFPEEALRLAERHWPGPLTILLPARPGCAAAHEGKVAVRVPDLPIVQTWIRASGTPLFSTSANRAGREPARDPGAVREAFAGRVDLLVAGPGFPEDALPSTIVDATVSPARLVRAGAVPFPDAGARS
jgi:L-threonylcarbamoyladenylate synthase